LLITGVVGSSSCGQEMQGGGPRRERFSFGQIRARGAGLLDESNNNVTFADVAGGCDEAKDEVAGAGRVPARPIQVPEAGAGAYRAEVLMVGFAPEPA